MRTALPLLLLLPLACATGATEPVSAPPPAETSAEAETETPAPEPAASENTEPADPPAAVGAKSESCSKACNRILECAQSQKATDACQKDCEKELAKHAGAAEEFARCMTEFGCNAIKKSLQQDMGAIGICRVSAQKKVIDPNSP